jgi:hypothetical protein
VTATVRFPVVARLSHRFARRPVSVSCVFEYDPADPWAVRLVLWAGSPDPMVWPFARELLAAGWWAPARPGGCVAVSPVVADGGRWVRIDLNNPREARRAVVWVPARVVDEFLTESFRRVPVGAEARQVDWDPTLRSWTDEGRAA